jgi:hypothetical protein
MLKKSHVIAVAVEQNRLMLDMGFYKFNHLLSSLQSVRRLGEQSRGCLQRLRPVLPDFKSLPFKEFVVCIVLKVERCGCGEANYKIFIASIEELFWVFPK